MMSTSAAALSHLHRHHLLALSGVAQAITVTGKLMNTEHQPLERGLAAIPAIRDKSNQRAILDWIQVTPFKLRWQKWGTLVPLGYNSNGPEWFVIKTTQKSFQRKEELLFSPSLLRVIFPPFHKNCGPSFMRGLLKVLSYSVSITSVCQTIVRMAII